MSENPLTRYKRQPKLFVQLPSGGTWYTRDDIDMVGKEIPIYGLSAIDDIMLNTPDALLNGQALENVIKNCAPTIKNVKNIVVPDLESIFVAIRCASTAGATWDLDRKCTKCDHENTYGIDLRVLLDTQTLVEASDTEFVLNNELKISVKPYVFELRQIYLKKQMDEQTLLKQISNENTEIDGFEKAKLLAESIERLSTMTFDLVARSIVSITILATNEIITDSEHIADWLSDVTSDTAKQVIDSVQGLNNIGVNKRTKMICESCENTWEETLEFDPSSFFTSR